MTDIPILATTLLGHAGERGENRDLLVVSPSLGTSVTALWSAAAERLSERFDVVGVDLPGHGASSSSQFTGNMAILAKAVLAAVAGVQDARGESGRAFFFAGVSVSGCIGLQLLLDAPARLEGAAIINSAAKIGTPAGWHERAAAVRRDGAASLRDASAGRWFAPGFLDTHPAEAKMLLDSLAAADAAGYAGVCEALAAFDLRDRLKLLRGRVLVIGGREDVAVPPDDLQGLAADIAGSRLEILPRVAHLAPAEQPREVAALLSEFFARTS